MRHTQPRLRSDQPALHERAADNLRYIRDTIERSTAFTAVPGWGGVVMGLSALVAAVVAHRQPLPDRWLLTWVAEAALAMMIGTGAVLWKASGSNIPLSSGPARRFAFGFTPPILVGAVLTALFYRVRLLEALPGTWLMLYGTAVLAAGAFSVRAVPLLGLSILVLGVAAIWSPPGWGDWYMALGFGALQIGFGLFIARRHGG